MIAINSSAYKMVFPILFFIASFLKTQIIKNGMSSTLTYLIAVATAKLATAKAIFCFLKPKYNANKTKNTKKF